MYLEHFGLSEPPFSITPHTDFFFSGGNRGATLDALAYAITHDQGIVKVSGEVGSGKTMLCRVLMERLPDNVTTIYLATPSLSREDILYAIAEELGLAVPENSRAAIVLKRLQEHLISAYSQGRQVVVLIDEAHAMPAETLEEIRLLSNLESNHSKLLQLVLFGQPELNDVLARPDMRQLKERITHNFMLEPLVRDDIGSYLEFRMRAAGYKGPPLFSARIIKAITQVSLGLTRRINILADKALLAAFANGSHAIGTREIQAAIKDCDFSQATSLHARRSSAPNWSPTMSRGLVAGVIVTVLLAVGAGWYGLRAPAPAAGPNLPVAASPSAAPATSTSPTTPAAPSSPAAKVEPVVAAPPVAVPATSPVAGPASTVAVPLSHPPAQTTGLGMLTQARLDAGNDWLAKAANSRWFLQLYAADAAQASDVETYLSSARAAGADMEQIRVYRSALSGKSRIGVIYGDYASEQAARSGLSALPRPLRESNPYPRQVRKLR
jgi:MSHA biogenesis protein MshM